MLVPYLKEAKLNLDEKNMGCGSHGANAGMEPPRRLLNPEKITLINGVQCYRLERAEMKLHPKVLKRLEELMKNASNPPHAHRKDRHEHVNENKDEMRENDLKVLAEILPPQHPTKPRTHKALGPTIPPQNTVARSLMGGVQDNKALEATHDNETLRTLNPGMQQTEIGQRGTSDSPHQRTLNRDLSAAPKPQTEDTFHKPDGT